jgi:hypothetical protein
MKTIIGIDPGVQCGFAVITYGTFREIKALTFWQTVNELEKAKNISDSLEVWIEDPNKNKPVFFRKHVSNDPKAAASAQLIYRTISQRVGSNKRDSQLLIEYCKLKGIAVISVRPSSKKMNARDFAHLTGITNKYNQHERDAAMLIFGRR